MSLDFQLIAKKWQLAISDNFAHILVMQQVTKKRIDEFIKDLKKITR